MEWLWQTIGFLGVVLLIFLSLVPGSGYHQDQIHIFDKVKHISAYGTLMLWFAQLHPPRRWVLLGLSLFALGIGLEWAQTLTPTRSWEPFDMVANAVGITLAWTLARRGGDRLLVRLEEMILRPARVMKQEQPLSHPRSDIQPETGRGDSGTG